MLGKVSQLVVLRLLIAQALGSLVITIILERQDVPNWFKSMSWLVTGALIGGLIERLHRYNRTRRSVYDDSDVYDDTMP